MIPIDARGLSCPQPAILARKAIEAGQFPIEIRTDSATSCGNVQRIAEKSGCRVVVAQMQDEYRLTISR
jgi:tRNA 2-thiouridine synthesizing protein A